MGGDLDKSGGVAVIGKGCAVEEIKGPSEYTCVQSGCDDAIE